MYSTNTDEMNQCDTILFGATDAAPENVAAIAALATIRTRPIRAQCQYFRLLAAARRALKVHGRRQRFLSDEYENITGHTM
jgi:hypothetical protein